MLTRLLVENRFLAAMGAAVVGLAVRSATPQSAAAATNPYEPYCHGYPECGCCNGASNCDGAYGYPFWLGCGSGGQCWYSVDSASCITYKCCDYARLSNTDDRCICTAIWPTC